MSLGRFDVAVVALIFLSGCVTARQQESSVPRESFREGSGRTVVMLGGGVYGAAMFAPHAADLSNEFEIIRVQTLNVQNARDKLPLPSNWSISDETDALAQTLTALGVDHAVDMVGSSLGAVVALHFAIRFPERVSTVTLFEPPAFWILPPEEFEGDPVLREIWQLTSAMKPSAAPSDEDLFRFRCLLGSCPVSIPAEHDPSRDDWELNRYAMRGLAAVPEHREDIGLLARLPHPVLLLRGSETVGFHQRINELLADEIPRVEIGEIPGGHTALRSAPAQFTQQLRAFLARHTPGGRPSGLAESRP